MDYLAFFTLLALSQVFLSVGILRLIRIRSPGGDPLSFWSLTGRVFLLMLAVNLLAAFPYPFLFIAVIVWLVGLMRLSGLDPLGAFILSGVISLLQFGALVLLAKMLDIPLLES